jgi:phosphoglycolate phosphatase-like HAD superfamily hydrolase
MIRLALFDIDGTLIRTGGAGVRAFGRTCEIVFGIQDGVRHLQFAGRTDTSLLREFLATHRLENRPEQIAAFYDYYVFLLDEYLRHSRGQLCPGVLEFIEAWTRLPSPPILGLLTGNILLGAEIKLRHFGLWDHFRLGAFGDDGEERPTLARTALQRGRNLLGTNLQPEEVLVIGDTTHDIACGRAIGAKVLAVATGGHAPTQLAAARPDWLLPDLTTANVAAISGPADRAGAA